MMNRKKITPRKKKLSKPIIDRLTARYLADREFNNLVDSLRAILSNLAFTSVDMKEAVILAVNLYKEDMKDTEWRR